MTPKQFITWFRGFSKAANGYNVTPKQWEDIQNMLNSVDINDENVIMSRYRMDTNESNTSTSAKINDNSQKQQLND